MVSHKLRLDQVEDHLIENGLLSADWLSSGKNKTAMAKSFLQLYKLAIIIQPNYQKDLELWRKYSSQVMGLQKQLSALKQLEINETGEKMKSLGFTSRSQEIHTSPLKQIVFDAIKEFVDGTSASDSSNFEDLTQLLLSPHDDNTIPSRVSIAKAQRQLHHLSDYFIIMTQQNDIPSHREYIRAFREIDVAFFGNKALLMSWSPEIRSHHEKAHLEVARERESVISERLYQLSQFEDSCTAKIKSIMATIEENEAEIQKLKSQIEDSASILILL